MATVLSFLSGRQITNNNGVAQAGALLYHYDAGTTNNQTVYSNQAGSTPHTQPVVCDAGGFVPLIYIGDTNDWKVVIRTSAEVELQTYDNLPKAVAEVSAADFAPPLLEWTQVTSASSPVALTAADAGKAYEADTTSGNIEFDLPSASSVGDGKGFVFKKMSASNTLTIDPNSTETIDDSSTSFGISNVYEALGIFSNGAEWYKVFSHFNSSIAIQAFEASGTYTPNARMRQCLVFSTGAGGGGGGTDSTDGSSTAGAGGGGAGGTCLELFTAATIGASQTVTIGAAGTAGANTGGTGGTGGDTTFGALHTASGGVGGVGATGGDDSFGGDGGAGGAATGGLVNIPGGGGASGNGIGSLAATGGVGGASFWGGGGRGTQGRTGQSENGVAGSAYGSGGSGACNVDNSSGNTGGAGAAGFCLVIEFLG